MISNGEHSQSADALLENYFRELTLAFPRLRFIEKRDDTFSKLIDRALRVLTFGGQSSYLTRYVTTIGMRIYLPDGWHERSAADRYIVLRHEVVHLQQFKRFGVVLMSLIYLLPFFPMGLAYGRAHLEWEAYAETLRAVRDVRGLNAARSKTLHNHIVRQFVSAAYGWMWPFPKQVQRWIDEEIQQMEQEGSNLQSPSLNRDTW